MLVMNGLRIAVAEQVRVSVNLRERRPPIGISSRDRAISSWESRVPVHKLTLVTIINKC
jgi:hypothetical protein